MAEIPTIPGSARVPDTQIGVKRDVTPRLRALGEARQTVGKANAAVQDAMGNVLEYEQRKQKAWEVAAFNNAATVTNKVTQGYASQLKQAKTEEAIKAIVPNWGKIASETKTNLLNNPDLNKTFDVALHLGTFVAVLVYFWRDVVKLVAAWVRSIAFDEFISGI